MDDMHRVGLKSGMKAYSKDSCAQNVHSHKEIDLKTGTADN